mmetsp:Transcript_72708/g.146332  ORF Transcript_72708/g.146332 Transcript_72708/m.146332 type:complete len:244 (+) Transcript_72708:718-1449(+)
MRRLMASLLSPSFLASASLAKQGSTPVHSTTSATTGRRTTSPRGGQWESSLKKELSLSFSTHSSPQVKVCTSFRSFTLRSQPGGHCVTHVTLGAWRLSKYRGSNSRRTARSKAGSSPHATARSKSSRNRAGFRATHTTTLPLPLLPLHTPARTPPFARTPPPALPLSLPLSAELGEGTAATAAVEAVVVLATVLVVLVVLVLVLVLVAEEEVAEEAMQKSATASGVDMKALSSDTSNVAKPMP